MIKSEKTIFFAYQSAERSKSSDSVDAIKTAIDLFNTDAHLRYKALSWEHLCINGRIVNKLILEAINNADYFACDLTYLNHNVLFELGYAIGKKKPLFIFLNSIEKQAKANYDNIELLKNVGYSTFLNGNDIVNAILKEEDKKPLLIEDLISLDSINRNSYDIFYIRNRSYSQAEIETYDFLKESSMQIIYDDSSEVEYRPLKWYIESVIKAKCIIIHVMSHSKLDAFRGNAKASLYAGLGSGFGKILLLLAPSPYNAPIDYEDILLQYDSSKNCVSKLSEWVDLHIERTDKEIYEERELDLLKLGLGYDVAEHEKDQLESYFIKTKSFEQALKNNRAFFVGRKGTGKTALYIMLNKTLKEMDLTYVISLKPESSELLNNVEVSHLYYSEASKQSFFHAIWKYVIYSKLLFEIVQEIEKQSKLEIELPSKQILTFYKENENILSIHFLETINFVYTKLRKKDENILNKLYELYINPMVKLIINYFACYKYYSVAILADNLDKTWELKNGLSLQADMLFSLLEVTKMIQDDLKDRKGNRVETKVILFFRKDIFNYLLCCAREPDKLILNKSEIDWSAFPGLLQKLIEKRFEYILNLKTSNEIKSIWGDYFRINLTGRQTVFERIMQACVPRPRDILYFIGQMFESAYNNGHKYVIEIDFKFALNEYSKFLYQHLISEMSSEFSNIRDILEHFHRRFIDKIEYSRFYEEMCKFTRNEEKSIKIIDSLIANGYIFVANERTGEKYEEHKDALDVIQNESRKVLCFNLKSRKPQVYVQLHSKYNRKRR